MYALGLADAERLIKRLMLQEDSKAAYFLLSRVLQHVEKASMREMHDMCKDDGEEGVREES